MDAFTTNWWRRRLRFTHTQDRAGRLFGTSEKLRVANTVAWMPLLQRRTVPASAVRGTQSNRSIL